MADAPDPETPTPKGFDYENLAKSVEQIREIVGAMVAALVADGFTAREARQIVAGVIGNLGSGSDQGA